MTDLQFVAGLLAIICGWPGFIAAVFGLLALLLWSLMKISARCDDVEGTR